MKALSFLITFFIIQLAYGQGTENQMMMPRNGFGFRLGFNRLHTLDRNTSALLYRGNIPTLGLYYQSAGNGNQVTGQIRIGRGRFYSEAFPGRQIHFRSEDIYRQIDSVSVPLRGTNTLFQLSAEYYRDIHPSGPYRYQVGGEVSNTLFYPDGFLQPGLMNLASLSPALGMAYHPGERQYFSLRVTVPLLSLVSRSTYNNSVSQPVDKKAAGFFDQGTRWNSWAGHREIRVAAAFHFQTGKRWISGLHYDFNLLKNTRPRDLMIMQSELGLSMQLR